MIKFSKTVLAVALAGFSLHAAAGVFDDDEARRAILDLRTKVESLQRELNARIDSKADKTATLDILAQHEQTMQEIAQLRGQIELLANEISIAQKRQKDFYADLDARLKKIEPKEVTIDGKTAAVDQAELNAYDAATQMLKDGDYKGAGAALQNFVQRYPGSSYAANAQYYLGTALYAQRDCKGAIVAQQQVVKQYPDSPRAPEALLNIASCQTELKAVNNAKKTLQELVKSYPDSEAAATARERLRGK